MAITANRLIQLDLTSDPTAALTGTTMDYFGSGLLGTLTVAMDAEVTGTLDVMQPGDLVDLNNDGTFEAIYEGRFNFPTSSFLLGDGSTVTGSLAIIEVSTGGVSSYFAMIPDAMAAAVDLYDVRAITFGATMSTSANTAGLGFDDASSFVLVCFAEGTRIRTEKGEMPVEALAAGDRVMTLHSGAQPVRWVQSRRVSGTGKHAPVVFQPGAIGNARVLRLSPNHRVYVETEMAEVLFGAPEVLVAAKDMVNCAEVRVEPVDEISYYHVLFDRHEVIWSEGALTESYFPGAYSLDGQDAATREEFYTLFPETRAALSRYGATAAMCLTGREARVLVDNV